MVINCWQQIEGGDYWKATLQQMSDECLLTCFLHLVVLAVMVSDCETLSGPIGGGS